VWRILGNPVTEKDVVKHKLFSVATIVEIVAGDKKKYINGIAFVEGKSIEAYIEKLSLFDYLIAEAEEYFERYLGSKKIRKPSGAAMIGFIRMWLGKSGYSKKFTKDNFLGMITSIYEENNQALRAGVLVINRDNSGRLLDTYIKEKVLVRSKEEVEA